MKLARKNIVSDSLKFGTASCLTLSSIYLVTALPLFSFYQIRAKAQATKVVDMVILLSLSWLYLL